MPDIQLEGAFYNVGERFTLYDTIGIYQDLADMSKQPPGWFATFPAFAGGTNHSFFNVRSKGSTEEAYCNLDARDQLPFAFHLESLGLSFWATTYAHQLEHEGTERYYNANPLWQSILPLECSATLKVMQDDKLKANALMCSPGYGPTGGGYTNFGAGDGSPDCEYPAHMAQTQGVADKKCGMDFTIPIDMPRRANVSVELSLTPYARALFALVQGPGEVDISTGAGSDTRHAVMFGITCSLNGRRLVQQRGALHA